tara:strand:- start:222 stop:464 length:243 start_codon:yes stop_codon:yes gene_type:complete
MRRYREVQCPSCKEYFDTTKYTSCPKEECKSMVEVREWFIDKQKGISKEIRHMTKEERQRAKEKEEANKCTQSNLKKTPQ